MTDTSAQQRIRDFLRVRTSYDVLPLSFRLIIFDTALLVKKSLTILIQNGETLRIVLASPNVSIDRSSWQASSPHHYGTPRHRLLQDYLQLLTTSISSSTTGRTLRL